MFDQRISIDDGTIELHNAHGLNINSGRDFINDYRHMLLGEVFHRTMSAPAIDYYLSRIAEERGASVFSLAVSAVEKHINYYEGIRKTNLKALRSVVDRHRNNSSSQALLATQDTYFLAAVQNSLADSPGRRLARLKKAAKFPVKLKVTIEAYVRNPDVIAEVLLRASGRCERCQAAAPFKRKKDSSPYLEIHHVKRLAEGGEDTVDNALALCPNCHRDLHYGIQEL